MSGVVTVQCVLRSTHAGLPTTSCMYGRWCWSMTSLIPLPAGAQVPISSYTCTQPNIIAVFLDHRQCTMLVCIVSIAVSTHLYSDTLYISLCNICLGAFSGGVLSCVSVVSFTVFTPPSSTSATPAMSA